MKKSLILLSLAAILAITGCSNSDNDNAPKHEVIADFESWAPDFQTLKLSYGFGDIQRNNVQKFVKSGSASARIRPKGHPGRKDILPFFYFPLRSKDLDFNKGVLSKYEYMKCSFYNDSNEDIPVVIGFLSQIETIYNVKKVEGETFVLKANSWTDISHYIDIDFLTMYFNIDEAPALYFQFEHQDYGDISFCPNLYLDDVVFTFASEVRKVNDEFELDENEICDFEKDFQKSFISVKNTTNGKVTFDVVEGTDEIPTTNGNKMLKITSHAKENWVNWVHLAFSEVYMKQTALSKISISEAERQQWAFVYDIRVEGLNGRTTQSIVPTFFTTITQNELYIGNEEVAAKEGEWRTIKLVFNKEYFDNAKLKTITMEYLLRIGEFHFSIPDQTYDYDIYIDNMRLEKVTAGE